MTPQDFVKWTQGYYGNYPDGQKRDIWEYVKGWDGEYLEALKKVLIVNLSSQFKTPPDIATLNKYFSAATTEKEKMAFAKEHRFELIEDRREKETEEDADSRLRRHCREAGVEYLDLINLKPGAFAKVLQHRIDSGEFKRQGGSRRIGKPLTWEAFR